MNLREAIELLDPNKNLSLDDMREGGLFVDRRSTAIRNVENLLNFGKFTKILFTGHKGNGKSTEFLKLEKELPDFWVVRYSAKDKLNVADLDYRDILFSIPLQIIIKALQEKLDIPNSLMKKLENMRSEIIKEQTNTQSHDTGVKLGIVEPLLNFFALESKLALQKSTREIVRSQYTARIDELNGVIKDLVHCIEKQTSKRILCVVEDIDKCSLSTARSLFHDWGQVLKTPELNMIYTFPIQLQYDSCFSTIRNYFPKVVCLPNFKTHDKENIWNFSAIDRLKEILNKRINNNVNLFTEEAKIMLAKYSNGIPRNLISLAQEACLFAVGEQKPIVDAECVKKALIEERNFFVRLLNQEYKKVLAKVFDTKEIEGNNEIYTKLLEMMAVLEFGNGETWHDVNAIVLPLLNKSDIKEVFREKFDEIVRDQTYDEA